MAKKRQKHPDCLTAEEKKAYFRLLPNCNLHHLIPTSRISQPEKEKGLARSQYILFPWPRAQHNAWHALFFNMTLPEVWRHRRLIHSAIFKPRQATLVPYWLRFRKNPKDKHPKILSSPRSISFFQKKWRMCFKSDDLRTAELYMRYMMLFMVFGTQITHPSKLLTNGTLRTTLKGFPRRGHRWWAFYTCFGITKTNPIRSIKAKLRNILEHNKQFLLHP